MALNYELGLAEAVEASRVLDALRRLGGRDLVDGRVALDPELSASVRSNLHPLVQEEFRFQWGFEVGISVFFSMGHKTDLDARAQSENRVAAIALDLPAEFDSDAGLLFSGEVTYLLRRGGAFTLYGDWLPCETRRCSHASTAPSPASRSRPSPDGRSAQVRLSAHRRDFTRCSAPAGVRHRFVPCRSLATGAQTPVKPGVVHRLLPCSAQSM
jgi:hypothetical protein